MLEICPERVDEFSAMRELIVEVFAETFGSGIAEASLVEELRSTDAHVPSLSFVALHESQVVGYILFTEVRTISVSVEWSWRMSIRPRR
jgi:predicted N-acetyltransferase YhbS